jgi:hypothetical protein
MPLYRTKTRMSRSNFRKAETLAETTAAKFLDDPNLKRKAMASPDVRRFAFESEASKDAVAVEIREGKTGKLHLHKVEYLFGERFPEGDGPTQVLKLLASLCTSTPEEADAMSDAVREYRGNSPFGSPRNPHHTATINTDGAGTGKQRRPLLRLQEVFNGRSSIDDKRRLDWQDPE